MSTSEWPILDNSKANEHPLSRGGAAGNKRKKGKGICPRCGKPGSGPYKRRVGRDQFGLYFGHAVTENGARRILWHYIPKSGTPSKRREELLRLIAREGWKSTWHYACALRVSERTIRRDVFELRASGMLIHRKYGGYIADPTGAILKENPWLGW